MKAKYYTKGMRVVIENPQVSKYRHIDATIVDIKKADAPISYNIYILEPDPKYNLAIKSFSRTFQELNKQCKSII